MFQLGEIDYKVRWCSFKFRVNTIFKIHNHRELGNDGTYLTANGTYVVCKINNGVSAVSINDIPHPIFYFSPNSLDKHINNGELVILD